jgi:hypothetical protein
MMPENLPARQAPMASGKNGLGGESNLANDWRAQQDSNLRPLVSETNTLSN